MGLIADVWVHGARHARGRGGEKARELRMQRGRQGGRGQCGESVAIRKGNTLPA